MKYQIVVGWMEQRHWVAVLCLVGLTICYMMRFCLSLVITVMTTQPGSDNDREFFVRMQEDHGKPNYLYDWSEHVQGIVLSSFFWGYFITQIPGGLLADRFGARIVLLVTVFGTSIFTLLTPPATIYGEWKALILVRILVGLVQGACYASLHNVVSTWIPPEERGVWGTTVFMGAHTGNFLSMLLTGQLLGLLGGSHWPVVFYLYGCVGLLWTLVFLMTTFKDPASHPSLSQHEKDILHRYLEKISKPHGEKKIPYKAVLVSVPVWALIVAMIGHDWVTFSLCIDLPKYLKSALNLSIKENGFYSSMGYLVSAIVAIVSGYYVDLIEKKKLITITQNRVIFSTISCVGPSVGLLLSAYTSNSPGLSLMFLIGGMGLMGTYYPSLKVNPIDLSPNHAGFVGSLGGFAGSVSGVIVPFLIGELTTHETLREWKHVFWISLCVMSLCNVFYIIFASGEIQPWDSETATVPETTALSESPEKSIMFPQ